MYIRKRQPGERCPAPPRVVKTGRQGSFAAVFACTAVVVAALTAAVLAAALFGGAFGGAGNSASRVLAAGKLKSVSCFDPVYYSENDEVTASADAASYNYYSDLRASYGLDACDNSSALSGLASYAAISAVSGDVPVSGASAAQARSASAGSAISSSAGSVSGVNGFVFKYFTDFSITDAGRAAEAFIGSLMNTDSSRTVLLSSIKSCGMASAIRVTEYGTECCFVFFYSTERLSSGASQTITGMLPAVKSVSGDLPAELASGAAGELTVKKGATVTENMLKDACGVNDLRGRPVSVSFAGSGVDTSAAGTATVNVSLSSGGRSVGSYVTLNVLENVAPALPENAVKFYGVPDGEILNVQPQTPFAGSGTKGLVTSPALVGSGDTGSFSQARVFIKDASGSVFTGTVAFESGGTEYAAAELVTTDLKGLTVRTPGGAALKAGGQAVLRLQTSSVDIPKPGSGSGSGGASGAVKIRYPYELPGGKKLTLVKADPTAVWNPEVKGVYRITAEVIDGSGAVIYSASVKIDVAKKDEVGYNDPGTEPTASPAASPTALPPPVPTAVPTTAPTAVPTTAPTTVPTTVPTTAPTTAPATEPTTGPTAGPADGPELTFLSEKLRTEETSSGIVLIRGIGADTSVASLSELLAVTGGGNGSLTVVKADGTLQGNDAAVATGNKILLISGGNVVSEYTVVISGDVNGDGQVGIGDFAKMRQQLLKGGIIVEIYVYAGDLNGDGELGIGDFAKLRQYLLGKIKLD